MDLQPSQNSHDEGDRLQTSESLSGFFSRMTVSNKTMERIMRQDSNLSPYDGFRIGGIGKLMFDIHPRIAYNLADQDFSRVLTLHQDFKRKDLMKEGNRPYSITYRIAYALSNTHHSDLFLRKEYIEIPRIFKELLRKGFFTKNPNTQYGNSRAKIMIGEHLERPGSGKRGDFDAKLTNPKMQDKRKFGKVLLSFRQQGLIDTDSFHEESEEELKNLKEAIQELKTLDISEESILSLENVKRLIQRNFSENPLAWWDRNKIEATLKIKEECKYEYVRYKPIQMNMEDKKDMQIIIKEHISLGLIEPGISAYSSPGFLVRNHGEIKRERIFRPLLKETESAKWKWEEIHTQRVRELKQVCNNLPKLAIPQDEDELVVYTDANDYRWAAMLMKKTTTGEELCRYTGGLFTEQQAQVWHINEKGILCSLEGV
ncbi:movement protein [Sesamum angolense]|uniref:Movement protein n=1 Tax=Sesamum angolense TaxID=2727404 RepID=A0AAE1T3Q0_9LAMI|nr:movement protein [Sesamum angolense]